MNFSQLFFAAIGLGFLFYGCLVVARVLRMRSWPSVPAELLNTGTRWEMVGGKIGRKLRVSYSYVVDGQVFRSSRVTISDFLLTTGELPIRYIVQRHLHPGARAYYDPRDPRTAVLVRPGAGLPLMMFVMAAAGLAVPVLSWFAKYGP